MAKIELQSDGCGGEILVKEHRDVVKEEVMVYETGVGNLRPKGAGSETVSGP